MVGEFLDRDSSTNNQVYCNTFHGMYYNILKNVVLHHRQEWEKVVLR